MTITQDWQGDLRGVTFGRGTDYPGIGGIEGIGNPPVRSTQTQRGTSLHGDHGGLDTYRPRVITIPIVVLGDDEADAATNLKTLKDAWVLRHTGEETLDLRLPGLGPADTTVRFYGRPRGLDVDIGDLKSGLCRCVGTFVATDPLAYSATPTTDNNHASGWTLAYGGDVDTDRITITITCDGTGPPSISNAAGGGSITWASTPANGQVRTIDIRNRTVTNSTTNDSIWEIAPTTEWFVLTPGNNAIVIDNVSDVDVSYQPAWI